MEAILIQGGLAGYVVTLFAFVLGICLTAVVYQMMAKAKAKTFEQDLQRQIDGAKKEAENIIKSAQIEAAGEAIKRKEQFTAETNQIRAQLRDTESIRGLRT
jgi:hypothetical protein